MSTLHKITYISTLVLTFALPWEDSISLPGIGSLARLMGFVSACFWMGTILVDGKFRKPNFFHVLVLLFFVWNFLSLFWSLDIESTIKRIKTYGQIFLLLLIYWEVFQGPEQLLAGLQAYVLGSYVLVASMLYNYYAGNVAVQYEGRYSATGVNANDVALNLILCLPIALHLLFGTRRDKERQRTWLRGINLLYMPLAIFSIVLTGSRTSLIAILPFLIYVIGSNRIKIERKLLIVVIGLAAIVLLLPFIPSSLISRLGTIGSSISGADLGGRVTMWRKSIVVLAQHPILGVGSGAIDRLIGGAVHNTLLTVAAETGFVGLMFFLSILGLAVYDLVRLPGRSAGLWLAIFATWAIGTLSLSWEFRKVTWIILSLIMIESALVKGPTGLPMPIHSSMETDVQEFLWRDAASSHPKVIG